MFRHKRIYKVIATEAYFASEKAIEGYYCAQVYWKYPSRSFKT